MTTGYVFQLDPKCPGFWAILFYGETTQVQLRIIETDSVYDACTRLGAEFAGRFIPADSDQIAWGRVVFKARGSALVLN